MKNKIFKLILSLSMLILAGIFVVNNAQAADIIISEDTTWEKGQILVVDGSDGLVIMSGATLTLNPGVIIKLAVNNNIVVVGNLIINGSDEDPVIITSIKDDNAGGDTNNDGSTTSPAPGDWGGLMSNSSMSKIIINHAQIKYGGYFNGASMLIAVFDIDELIINYTSIINNSGVIMIGQANTVKINYSNIYNPDFCLAEDPFGVGTPIIYCGGAAIMNLGGTTVDAFNVYWGHDEGPTLFDQIGPGNIKGTLIQGLVNYQPFLTEPWEPELPEPEINPVIIVPGIMGSWNLGGEWQLDPILNTYDNLWEALQLAGYTVGETLFAFPYQWRQSNMISATELKNKIQEIKQICECDKVDIVAHSMGGLVSRYYAQSDDYQNDIDQLIFLATPHIGSPESYLKYEGAYFSGGYSRLKKYVFQLEAGRYGYLSLVNYIREKVVSVEQLLPIYNYLQEEINNNWQYRIYPTQYPRNIFLENLNTTSNIEILKNRVNITNIVSSVGNTSTLTSIKVVPYPYFDIFKNKWPDGYPYDIENNDLSSLIDGNGDGTVPYNSLNYLENVSLIELTNSDHGEMVTYAQKDVIEKLIGTRPDEEIAKGFFEKLLMIRIFSPADFVIIAPDGKKLGKDFSNNTVINEIERGFYTGFDTDIEFAVILDPIDGEYKVKLQGTDNDVYTVSTSYIDDQESIDKEFTGLIETDESQEFSITYDSQAEEPISDLEPEFVITISSTTQLIKEMYTLGWIAKKAKKRVLLNTLKHLDKRLRQIDKKLAKIAKQTEKVETSTKFKQKVKDKKLKNFNKRLSRLQEYRQKVINRILDRFIKQLDRIKAKNHINQDGYDILINNINYLRINL